MSASIKTQHVSDGTIGGYLLGLDQFIDIYIVNDLDINSSYLLDTYRLIMSDDEKARSGRFYFKRDQRQFVIGRSLIRSTLSRYMPATEPQAWRFTTGPFGRPAIENTDRIYCNLAHTRGAIVLAVASTPLIGVDVENRHRRPVNVAEIAARYFCCSEYEALMALPVALRQDTFFDMWTLKEAYVKACGAGLTVPFTDVCFKFQGDTGVSLSFASGRADDPSRWRLWCLKPTPVTTLAVAVADHHDDVALRLFRGIPMIGFEGVPAQFHRVCHPSPR